MMATMAQAKIKPVPAKLRCKAPLTANSLTPAQATDNAKVFKALSDPVRLRLLSLIASDGDGEVCVYDLIGKFDVTAPTISFHLRVLREAGLVESERRAAWVYYRVKQAMFASLSCFFTNPTANATQ
jgi:ArsR family transcriptional regulator, arsenate/arsenite/antimonite-responsive transcriptional repressor